MEERVLDVYELSADCKSSHEMYGETTHSVGTEA